jgi:hypothetical protein
MPPSPCESDLTMRDWPVKNGNSETSPAEEVLALESDEWITLVKRYCIDR